MKERFLPEDHAGQHAPQTPHVQAVVVHLQTQSEALLHRVTNLNERVKPNPNSDDGLRSYLVVYQQLRSFEIPGCYSHVVFLVWVVELGQTPVD